MHIRRAQLILFAHLIVDDGDPLLKQMLYGECLAENKKPNKTYISLTKNWTTALTMFCLKVSVFKQRCDIWRNMAVVRYNTWTRGAKHDRRDFSNEVQQQR